MHFADQQPPAPRVVVHRQRGRGARPRGAGDLEAELIIPSGNFLSRNFLELRGKRPAPARVLGGPDILQFQELARQVVIAEEVARYAVRLVDASRPGRPGAADFVEQWVKWGAGLRGSQALVRGGKARALMHGRYHVAIKDIQALAKPILRHRIMTNFYAESERITSDAIIDRLLELVPPPRSGM